MAFNTLGVESYQIKPTGEVWVDVSLFYVLENSHWKNDNKDVPYMPIPLTDTFTVKFPQEIWKLLFPSLSYRDISVENVNHMLNNFIGNNDFCCLKPDDFKMHNPFPHPLDIEAGEAAKKREEREWLSMSGLTPGAQ